MAHTLMLKPEKADRIHYSSNKSQGGSANPYPWGEFGDHEPNLSGAAKEIADKTESACQERCLLEAMLEPL
ncbi:MAG: hypothetical protein ACO1QB_05600 [Verrucomicrobiales bacterium]